MRRDKLERIIKLIRWKKPKWFYKRCSQCSDDVKDENMWYFKQYYSGYAGYPSLCSKTWVCMECAPRMSDVILLNSKYFGDHYGDVDLAPLVDEEEEMAMLVAEGATWGEEGIKLLKQDIDAGV
jgi:hypothetical protein